MESLHLPQTGQKATNSPGSASSGGTGRIAHSAAAAGKDLQSGKALEGRVIEHPKANRLIVQTPKGKITIETTVSFPVGSKVAVTPKNNGDGQQVRVQAKPVPQTSIPAKSVQIPPQVSTNLSNSQAVRAQVTGANTQGQITMQTAEGRSLTIETQASLPKGTTVTLARTAGSQDLQIRVQPHPTPPQTSSPPPPPSVTARPVQLPSQVSTSLSSGQAVQAQVTGTNAQGQTVLQTPEGRSLTVETQATLPRGTTVTLTQTGSGQNAQIRAQPHPTPPQTSSPPPPSVTARPVQLPPQVSTSLSSGQAVQATVTTSPDGRLTLQSAQGTITVDSRVNLPRGTPVSITQTGGGSNPVVTVQPQQPAAQAPTTTQTATPAASNSLNLTATTAQLPPQANAILSAGQTIQGQVTGSAGQNTLTLQTPQGQVTVNSAQSLPAGTTVTISLAATSGNTTTLLLQPQTPTILAGDANSILTNFTLGTRFTATILGGQSSNSFPVPPGASAQSQTTTPTGGPQQAAPLGQRASSVQPTASSGVLPSATTATGAASSPAAAGAPAQSGQLAQPSASPTQPTQAQALPPGHQMPVRLIGLQLPGGAPVTLPDALPAGQSLLSGTVTASANGQTTVQTAQSTISLPTGQPVPVGTTVQLATLGAPSPLSDLPGLPGLLSAERWQALSEAVSLLQAGDVTAAQRLVQLVPQNSPQLGNALLFLFSALRIGSAERWVGKDIMRSLEQIRAGSAARLGDSVQSAQTRVADGAGQDWKVFHMPFLADSELDELRLYLRDRAEEERQKQADEQEDKRFIIETNFTRLGPMQFDGYSRKKQFDLMIRTHSPLDDTMRDDIRKLFANAVSALGISGAVGFHVTEKFEISVEETPDSNKVGVTV